MSVNVPGSAQTDGFLSRALTRRNFLRAGGLLLGTWVGKQCMDLFSSRKESDCDKPIAFDDIPEGEALINKRIILTPTLPDTEGKTVMLEIIGKGQGLFLRINGKAYELQYTNDGNCITYQVINIRRKGREFHVHCKIGLACVSSECVANQAFLVGVSPEDDKPLPVSINGSFAPRGVPPGIKFVGQIDVYIRRNTYEDR